MKNLKPGLLPGLIIAIIMLAACSSPAAEPTDAPDDGDDTATTAPETDAGGDDAGADAGGYDLCDAASEDEVSQIAGAEVVDSTSVSSGGVLSCNYNAADGAVAGTTLATSESGIDPQELFDANQGAEGNEDISGLGDAAVLTGDEDFPILMVMVNGNMYSVSVLADTLDGPGKRQATIDLAELSVDRLP